MAWFGIGVTAVVLGCLLYKYSQPTTETAKQHFSSTSAEQTHERDQDEKTNSTAVESKGVGTRRSELKLKQGPDAASLLEISPSNEGTNDRGHSTTLKATQQNGQPVLPTGSLLPATQSSQPPPLKAPTIGVMPAAPRPKNSAPLRPPPSAASMLRIPPTKVLSNASMAPSSLMPPPSKPSRKVMLAPGHSPLDWAMLTSNPNVRLRGDDMPDDLIRVPPSQLKYHNGRKGRNAWTVLQGKVYNITPYLPFHPGGEGELMRGAGKDGGKLFMEIHPWVNWEGMLAECLIGILVGEGEEKERPTGAVGNLDDMD